MAEGGSRFKVGKIVSKYIILEILGYAFKNHLDICFLLYSSSKTMRLLLLENYTVLKTMLWETNIYFEATVVLTSNYLASKKAHDLLEKMLKIKITNILTIDYGLEMNDEVELKVANREENAWIL